MACCPMTPRVCEEETIPMQDQSVSVLYCRSDNLSIIITTNIHLAALRIRKTADPFQVCIFPLGFPFYVLFLRHLRSSCGRCTAPKPSFCNRLSMIVACGTCLQHRKDVQQLAYTNLSCPARTQACNTQGSGTIPNPCNIMEKIISRSRANDRAPRLGAISHTGGDQGRNPSADRPRAPAG